MEEEGWGREVTFLLVNDVTSLWKFCQSFCGNCQTAEWGRSGTGEPFLPFLFVPFPRDLSCRLKSDLFRGILL